MLRITTGVLTLVATFASPLRIALAAEPSDALVGAHAHNDYYHKRPLHDALERGFTSIEADVFLVDGKLLVGHYAHELKPERTLEALYLEPLRRHIGAHDGRVFSGDERLTLLVDFKTDGPATYAVLAVLLEKYDGVFFEKGGGKMFPGAVEVIVTGNRPIEAISQDKVRRVAVDGRLADLDGETPQEVVPLVSESWTNHFKWRGKGPMPEAERRRLRDIVVRVHQQGRRLRFWATPDDAAVWKELQAAGVDVIGVDNLGALKEFLTAPSK